ncbi:MAG: glutamine synthetase III [Saprospiraceae bacterium]|nr:glutamine synthetase III [Saprospiraceae bacterium]
MSISRFGALDTIINRSNYDLEYVEIPDSKISEFFGCNVFNDKAMQKYLTPKAYTEVKEAISTGQKLSREQADVVADGMKRWAMEMGATHYTHWFQPLTGRTAEKHDSFFTLTPDGQVLEEFDGDTLVQQEPDGSSFPGGGLRSTFEARGYTAWDPSSAAFIFEVGEGRTLCIPTIFVTYGGESLDYKLPLLKSQAYIEEAAVPVCQYFDPAVTHVKTTLGWEQEYFLVDEALFNARPDLVLTGRTLLGKHSPKGQQLDDHYFGSIPERVFAYMRDLETECHKLGIPVRTRHNEVGPGQYELAPMFEETNLAVDHNQLLMDLMDRVAARHKLRVLLHEKPFAGVNGSGKHNNWSMATNTGKNLLSPGKKPGMNLRFLTFFVATIQAVYKHADLLRASVASASNDHRLGANEAPPAIISVFIGDTLTKVLDDIEKGEDQGISGVKDILDLLSKIPNLELDNTDRNRTSPFAFTGNKFEIRMVGSTMNCAAPMTIMNTIVGKQLKDFYEEVEGLKNGGKSQEDAIFEVIRKYVIESKAIRFEGDGYSDEWRDEAAKRGLGNTPNTPDALDAYVSKSSKDLFLESGVFTEKELDAHYEVMCENYILKLQIESRTISELVLNHIIPAAVKYQTILAENVKTLKEAGMDESSFEAQKEILTGISMHINGVKKGVDKIYAAIEAADSHEHAEKQAKAYATEVKPVMDEIRDHADQLEYLVDDTEWPLVKYRELMFMR